MYSDKGQLIDRLTFQVGDRKKAIAILQSRGHLEADGVTLTPEGMKRDMMTAAERAIDRASKRLGISAENLIYNEKTNVANKIKNF
jgi:hypothetical protein